MACVVVVVARKGRSDRGPSINQGGREGVPEGAGARGDPAEARRRQRRKGPTRGSVPQRRASPISLW